MLNKKNLFNLFAVALLFAGSGANADLLLEPDDADHFGTGTGGECESSSDTDCEGPANSKILAWLDANIAGFDSDDELYKSDVDSGDSGPFDASYDTTYSNGNSDALIHYTEGGSAISDPQWLFVKDGSNEPVWYLFDIATWDGFDNIVLEGFWANVNGAISHVAIYGGDDVRIPEPGTLMLLGLGLLGLGMGRRTRRRA